MSDIMLGIKTFWSRNQSQELELSRSCARICNSRSTPWLKH